MMESGCPAKGDFYAPSPFAGRCGQVICYGEQHVSEQDLLLPLSFFFKFIYFWLRWIFVAAHGLSLVAAGGGGLLFVAVRGLLIALASLVAEHGL